jgi:hypothetical protein
LGIHLISQGPQRVPLRLVDGAPGSTNRPTPCGDTSAAAVGERYFRALSGRAIRHSRSFSQ